MPCLLCFYESRVVWSGVVHFIIFPSRLEERLAESQASSARVRELEGTTKDLERQLNDRDNRVRFLLVFCTLRGIYICSFSIVLINSTSFLLNKLFSKYELVIQMILFSDYSTF